MTFLTEAISKKKFSGAGEDPLRRECEDIWQRRFRARQRDGLMVPTMPGIGADEISFLIETQWFDERDACDRRAIGCAIARAITRN